MGTQPYEMVASEGRPWVQTGQAGEREGHGVRGRPRGHFLHRVKSHPRPTSPPSLSTLGACQAFCTGSYQFCRIATCRQHHDTQAVRLLHSSSSSSLSV